MRALDLQSVNQQQMERNCRKATRVTTWNRSHFNLKRYKTGTREKTNVLVSKRLAVRFVISRGVVTQIESPVYGDRWKWANFKWIKWEMTDVAATRGAC